MRKFEKAKKWCREHKEEIIAGTIFVTGTALLAGVYVKFGILDNISKKYDPFESNDMFVVQYGDMEPFDESLGYIEDIWEEKVRVMGIFDNVPLNKMGEFGKALMDRIPQFDGGTKAGLILGVSKVQNN